MPRLGPRTEKRDTFTRLPGHLFEGRREGVHVRTVELPAGTSRIVIADLLKWVSETGRDGFLDVYVADDGRMEIRTRNWGPFAKEVKVQFIAFCRRERVEPTSPHDRWERNYTGEGLQDGVYEVTLGEAQKFAEAFDLALNVAKPSPQPEPPPAPAAQVEPVQAVQAEERIDLSMLAEPGQLIEAFGRFTDMDKSWFSSLKDKPGLKQARRVEGMKGRGGHKPLFCPLAVMLWLTDDKRKVGSHLSTETGWRLLESYFPRVYAAHAAADPR